MSGIHDSRGELGSCSRTSNSTGQRVALVSHCGHTFKTGLQLKNNNDNSNFLRKSIKGTIVQLDQACHYLFQMSCSSPIKKKKNLKCQLRTIDDRVPA